MNYSKIYNQLIERAKTRILEGYSEKHHIIPKCLGGSNNSENLVKLTPEEHYVAHQLLVKIYPDKPKLVFAAHKMCQGRPGNKLYGWLRRKYSGELSRLGKQRIGEKNGSFGTMWITNGIENKKIKKIDIIPEGWYTGKVQLETRGIPNVKKGTFLSQETRKKISDGMKGYSKSDDHCRKLSLSQRCRYRIINPEGQIFEIEGLNLFCKNNKLHTGGMSQVASGKRKQYKGWFCKKL